MLEPYGIAGCQYLFLMTLFKNNGASQEKISDSLKIDKTTTAKSIKKLEDNGFVMRDVDFDDKRAYKVFLTQKALNIIPHIQETMKKWENIVISDISEDEYMLLEKLLKQMAEKAFNISN
jgi:DNA-binding MarR family transcriptional regulator